MCILGLFLFFTEDRMRHDGAALLFVLIFKDFLRGSPTKATFSIPSLIDEIFQTPFIAHTHLTITENSNEDLYCEYYYTSSIKIVLYLSLISAEIVLDKWSLSSLQVQWNADIHNGFKNLININEANFSLPPDSAIVCSNVLDLKPHDLQQIKVSSVHYCLQKYLYNIQNATAHEVVQDCLAKLAL